MEHYYFVEKNGHKLGPLKLADLAQQLIYFDQLIWRSDSSEWRQANMYAELQELIVYNPPLTPSEEKLRAFNLNFKTKILPKLIIAYLLAATIFSIVTYTITKSSWEKYLSDTQGKYLLQNQPKAVEGRGPLISDEEFTRIINDPKTTGTELLQASSDHSDFRNVNYNNFISNKELSDNKRYPIYTRGINNESQYANNQPFLFKCFAVYYSTIYLTYEEQEDSSLLLKNLILSTLSTFAIIFLGSGIFFYFIFYKNQTNCANHQS